MSLKKGKEQTNIRPGSKQQKDLRQRIQKERQNLAKINQKVEQMDHKISKVTESNARNAARLIRHRARLHQIYKCREHPQILLAYSGIMNEYVQTFMISHNFQMNVDVTNMNPDQMSYEQLLQLGDKIGKVSKGLSKEQIQQLEHIKIKKKSESCPICCTEFQVGEIGVHLRCKHIYHQECIVQWLKDQNKCPICKQYVLKEKEEEKS